MIDPAPDAGMRLVRPNLEQGVTTINGRLLDVYFGYDHFDVATDAIDTLRQDAELLCTILRAFPARSAFQ